MITINVNSVVTAAANGVYLDSNTIKLGGNLTEDTTITNNGFLLTTLHSDSRSTEVRADGVFSRYNGGVSPTYRYNPTGYNSGAGVLISSLGTAVTQAATLHVRASSNSALNKGIYLESAAATELFSVNDAGTIYGGGHFTLINGAYLRSASGGANAGMRLLSDSNVFYNNLANAMFTVDFGSSRVEVMSVASFRLSNLAGATVRIPSLATDGTVGVLSGTGVVRMAGSVVSFDTTVVTSSATTGFIPYMSSATNVANSPFFYDTAAFTVTGGNSTLINGYNFIRTSSATDVRTVASFYHKTTSTPAIGLGGRIGFGGSDSAGTQVAVAAIGSEYEVITAGNTSGALVFFTSTGGGAFMDRGRITGAGLWGIGKTPGLGALLDVNGATKTLYTSGFYLTNGTTMNGRWYHNNAGSVIMDRIATTDFVWQQATATQMVLTGGGLLRIGGSGTSVARLDVVGGQTNKVTTVNSASATIAVTDRFISVTYTATGAVTLTLPSAAACWNITDGTGIAFFISDTGANSATNNITVNRAGSDTIIDDATGQTSTVFASNGSGWWIQPINSTTWKVY